MSEREFSKPILVATWNFPPIPGGSSVIMKNLLDSFCDEQLVLATSRPRDGRSAEREGCYERHFVLKETSLSGRLERIRRLLLRPRVTRRLVRLGRRYQCGAMLGVYPDLMFLDASERAARVLGVPFFPYLHDTVAEAATSSRYAIWARRVQERVFRSASRVFVATGGMENLYRRKYDMEVVSLVHIYPEPVPDTLSVDEPQFPSLLWAGNTYSINSTSLLRVFAAMRRRDGLRLTIATGQSEKDIADLGFNMEYVDCTYIPVSERPRYLELIRQHAVLVLALNWPDETHVHEDELATIFPTKTPEYLASGRPIIVHCPEHYYLAKFFKNYGCGEVVSERSGEAVEAALNRILDSEAHQRELGLAGLKAAKQFSRDLVADVLLEVVTSVLSEEKS